MGKTKQLSKPVRFAAGFLGAIFPVVRFLKLHMSMEMAWWEIPASLFLSCAFIYAAIKGESPVWLENPLALFSKKEE